MHIAVKSYPHQLVATDSIFEKWNYNIPQTNAQALEKWTFLYNYILLNFHCYSLTTVSKFNIQISIATAVTALHALTNQQLQTLLIQ